MEKGYIVEIVVDDVDVMDEVDKKTFFRIYLVHFHQRQNNHSHAGGTVVEYDNLSAMI